MGFRLRIKGESMTTDPMGLAPYTFARRISSVDKWGWCEISILEHEIPWSLGA